MDKMTAAEQSEREAVTLNTDIAVLGGTSAMAGSGTMGTGSTWQKEDGYEDSPEKLVEDMMVNGPQRNDRATVEPFAGSIGEAFDWLVGEDGAAVPYQRSGDPDRSYFGMGKAYAAGGFMVDQDGTHFFNESGNAWDLMQAMKQNTAQYLIMDQAAFDGFNAGMTGSKIYIMGQVAEWIKDDFQGQPVRKTAATLDDLAEKLGVPADALKASAASFNEKVEQEDGFGHTIKAAQSEEGPFYALQMHIRYLGVPGRPAHQQRYAGAHQGAASDSRSVRRWQHGRGLYRGASFF